MSTNIAPPPGYENYVETHAPINLTGTIAPPKGYEAYVPSESVTITPHDRDDRSNAQKVLAGLLEGGILDPVEGGINTVAHPVETLKSIAAASRDQWDKASQAFNRGAYAEGFGHIAGTTPIIGPMVYDLVDALGDKDADMEDVARKFANVATVLGAPDIVKGMNWGATKVSDWATKADTAKDLINTYGITDPRFSSLFKTHTGQEFTNGELGAGYIKKFSPDKIVSNEQLAKGTSQSEQITPAVTNNRDVWNRWMNRAQILNPNGVSGSSIIQVTRDNLAKTLDPTLKQAIIDDAQRNYSGNLSIQELQDLLKEKNGELKAFYSKDEGAKAAAHQAGAQSGRTQALLDAQAQEIRNLLYKAADPANAGAGPREVQHAYGAINTIKDEANNSRTAILGETAGTKLAKAAKTAAAAVDVVGGPFKEGGIANALLNVPQQWRGKSDPIIARAFRNAPNVPDLPEPPPTIPSPVQGPNTASRVVSALYNAPVTSPPGVAGLLGPSRTFYSAPELMEGATPEAKAAWQEHLRNVGPNVIITPDASATRIVPAQPAFRVGFGPTTNERGEVIAPAPKQLEAINPETPRNFERGENLYTEGQTRNDRGRFEPRGTQVQNTGDLSAPNKQIVLHVKDGVLYKKGPDGENIRLGSRDELDNALRERLRQGKPVTMRDIMNGDIK